ncbi:MAG TPA: CBS domain-containing protein [Kofleriaceae bacterium]|nr:CBS domain-containing protein [Kofleriaceae bacterium]
MRRLQTTIEAMGWTKEVPRLGREDRVIRAFDAMSGEAHDCVLVMDDGEHLAGIFTSRDFLNRVAGERGDPAEIRLGDVMTPNPRTLRPRDPVAFAINWMAVEGFRNVPIVDDLGRVLGVLTIWDVMRHLGEMFDEIDATPRERMPNSDTSSVVSLIDIGGGA